MNEIFSDHFARRQNFLTRLDARIKLIFVMGAIAAVVSSSTSVVPVIVSLSVALALIAIKIPFKVVMIRLAPALGFAIVISLIKIFHRQTLPDGALTLFKIMGSTALVLFLGMTTPVDMLLAAFRWFRVPDIWIEICMISYRYIFVLLEDVITVFDAQKVRLGYTDLRRSLSSIGALAGSVVIRAYDQSVSTYEAMIARGYKGRPTFSSCKAQGASMLKNMVASAISVGILVFLVLLNRVFRS